jgi:hypothetical protein
MNILKKLKYLVGSLYFLCRYGRPNLQFRRALVSKNSSHPTYNQHAQQLENGGILILPSYYSGDTLKQMQIDFERWVPQKPTENEKEFYELDKKLLKDSIPLSRFAVDPYLNDLVAYYWGRHISLAETSGVRLNPCEPYEDGSFQWHHDAIRKQIKVYVFLTEVPENGQTLDYIPKTHNITHWAIGDYQETRFSQEEIEQYFKNYSKPINCSCPAGTVVIFDTNGLHRGNRNLGARRDSWTFNFNGGNRRQFHTIPNLHPEVLACLDENQKRMVRTH